MTLGVQLTVLSIKRHHQSLDWNICSNFAQPALEPHVSMLFKKKKKPQRDTCVYCVSLSRANIYLGVDCLAHGNTGTLECILLHTEVASLVGEGDTSLLNYWEGVDNSQKVTFRIAAIIMTTAFTCLNSRCTVEADVLYWHWSCLSWRNQQLLSRVFLQNQRLYFQD